MSSPDENLERKGRALSMAARIAAAGSGTYLAMLLGPAGGAAAAQALGELGDALGGKLIDWELRRVNRMLIGVRAHIDGRVSSGEEVREELSDPDDAGAQAVFESVVEAAARSIEEKKCDLIANFYASVAFDRTIPIDDALLYLRRIRAASWRQLVALRYVEDESRMRERELIGVAGAEGDAHIQPALGIELSELAGRGLELIGIGQDDGSVSDPSSVFGGGTITSQTVAKLRPTGLGEKISQLGRLAHLVTEEELDAIADGLRSHAEPIA